MRILPRIAAQLTELHDAWIVGSGANQENTRDLDILVPFRNWPEAAILIPENATPNTFGGWKFMSEGQELDVWPGDLAQLLAFGKTNVVWHPKSGLKYGKLT